ncbi:MAG: hypothetical protein WBV73_15515 [Phormidium sp.]
MTVNESRIEFIKSTIKKIENGIAKGTWKYTFSMNKLTNYESGLTTDTYRGKAVSGSYTVEMEVENTVNAGDSYKFIVRNAEELLREIKEIFYGFCGEPYIDYIDESGIPMYAVSPEATTGYDAEERDLINESLEILEEAQRSYLKIQEETQLKEDLKILDELPD